jgi:hypothetical protein
MTNAPTGFLTRASEDRDDLADTGSWRGTAPCGQGQLETATARTRCPSTRRGMSSARSCPQVIAPRCMRTKRRSSASCRRLVRPDASGSRRIVQPKACPRGPGSWARRSRVRSAPGGSQSGTPRKDGGRAVTWARLGLTRALAALAGILLDAEPLAAVAPSSPPFCSHPGGSVCSTAIRYPTRAT